MPGHDFTLVFVLSQNMHESDPIIPSIIKYYEMTLGNPFPLLR
jgi:hypothetical protein